MLLLIYQLFYTNRTRGHVQQPGFVGEPPTAGGTPVAQWSEAYTLITRGTSSILRMPHE